MGRAAYKCCVQNCSFKDGVSHRFPNPKIYVDIMKEWIKAIGLEFFYGLDPETIYYTKRICSNHFTSSDYSTGSKRLKKNSIPTVNLSSPTDRFSPNLSIQQSKEADCSTKAVIDVRVNEFGDKESPKFQACSYAGKRGRSKTDKLEVLIA
ncbi:uncharacterized protein LOC111032896 [Myzus persicae]|uniref:uncharacterized protein LOC111032896 n=1 Tax=Myzus persicae TaxID=13164 RepID=UPI000B935209|nr:uncharacterized protein LOC111032896 [Myzus persicae]